MTTTAPATQHLAARERPAWDAACELGLLALAVGTVAGFNRLFLGWGFLTALLPVLALAWLVPLVLRRVLAVAVPVALAIDAVIGIVVLTVRFAPGTHLAGLPTGATVSALNEAIDVAFGDFSDLVAPVPAANGFLVVIAAAMWVFAFFADTAAMRYRGIVQAAVPHLSVFLTLGILARSSGRTVAAVWFAAGLATYAVTQIGRTAYEERWVHGMSGRGARAVAGTAAALSVVALVGGLVLAPLLPGGTEPVVDLREIGRGSGPRTVVSPFVGLRSLLGQRSDDIVFTVRADEPAYWRLTALEQFDAGRHIWVSSGTYASADGVLAPTGPEVRGPSLRQDYEVTGLGGLWLPGAYVPRRYTGDAPVSFDQRSASIILREDVDGPVAYELESVLPDFDALAASSATRIGDGQVDDVHFETPAVAPAVEEAIRDATAGRSGDVERLLALQNWFRSRFAYDERVDFSADEDPLAAFLDQRRGFCQQFSSAFALMARSLGMASRVAVGFTPGDPEPVAGAGDEAGDEAGDRGTGTRYVVRGRHAHAWPEVHIAGVGWVPFEPTPQRGDPQSTEHTGVSPAQAERPEHEATTTTADPAAGDQPTTTAGTGGPPTTVSARGEPDDTRRSANRVTAPAVLLSVVALGAIVVWVLRRRSRSRRGDSPRRSSPQRAAVSDAWLGTLSELRRLGVHPAPSETPSELSQRAIQAITALPDAALERTEALAAALDVIATAETRARFGPVEPTADEIAQAEASARQVREHLRTLQRPDRDAVGVG